MLSLRVCLVQLALKVCVASSYTSPSAARMFSSLCSHNFAFRYSVHDFKKIASAFEGEGFACALDLDQADDTVLDGSASLDGRLRKMAKEVIKAISSGIPFCMHRLGSARVVV